MTLTVTEAGLALADPAAYTDEARLHEALTLLRREAPVHRVRAPGFEPFWAITRHADIMEIERQNSLFLNAPRPLLATVEMDAMAKQREAEGTALRTLIHMDDPQHRVVRAIGADWFRPRAMRAMEVRVAELARHYVDRMAELRRGMRLRHPDRRALPAVRDPLAARAARIGLPAPAHAHPGAVRRRRRGTAARRHAGGADGGPARLLRLLPGPHDRAPGRTRPTTSPRRSPTPASTASTCRTSTPPPTTSSSPPPATTPPAPPSPAACTRSSSTPASWPGCATTRPCCRPRSTR